jgi:hypothetical protein
LSFQPVEGWPEHLQSSPEVSPRLNQETCSKARILPMTLSPKAVLSIRYVSDAVSPSLKQHLTQMCCFSKSAVRKSWIVLNTHNINTLWKVTQSVMVTYLTRLTQKIAILWHVVAESCTTCSSHS